ncbi:response regulator [Alsobacter sp. KACC 23698]|uniref:Response regulator n=1 Tax=Alsobacter sp. KACC 23698 TaxID=3149229 RepID=A0AAU7JJ78_9HYPH
MARRRAGPTGAFDGVIVASLGPEFFANAFKGLVVSPDDAISFIREDGAMLARGPQPLRQPVQLAPDSGPLANLHQGEMNAIWSCDGSPRTSQRSSGRSYWIAISPRSDWPSTLNLPRAEIDARVAPTPTSGDQRPAAARRRVLLVEDNLPVAEVGRAILVERGHAVTVCANARDALALLAQGAYDVVRSDRVMPGAMNGLDLARAVAARHAGLPIVLMTGYSEAANRAIAEGFTLLLKPYEPLALAKAVESAGAPESESAT